MLIKNIESKVKVKENNSDATAEKKTQIEELSENLLTSIDTAKQEMLEFYEEITQQEDCSELEEDVQQKVRSYRRAVLNIAKANQQLVVVRDEFSARWNDLTKKRRKFIPTAPANAVIDLAENKSNHFAKGINVYKLLLICFMGSFFWCVG